MCRDLAERCPPDREEGAGHGGQPAGPALQPSDGLFVSPVGAFVPTRLRPLRVEPGEAAGRAADSRIDERRHQGREATRLEPRLGVRQDDDLALGRREDRVLGRRLATARKLDEAHPPIGRGDAAHDVHGPVGRAVRGDDHLEPERHLLGQDVGDPTLEPPALLIGGDADGDESGARAGPVGPGRAAPERRPPRSTG